MASEADQLAAEIARLQAKQRAIHEKEERRLAHERKLQTKVLIGASPVKRAPPPIAIQRPAPPSQPRFAPAVSLPQLNHHGFPQPLPGPSSLARSLAHSNRRTSPELPTPNPTGKATNDSADVNRAKETAKRDEDTLKVIIDLKPGPKEFGKDKEGTNEWLTQEPNSGFNLKDRVLSHEQLQANLSDRILITPSELYAIMQVSRDGQAYNVPVDAEWATIAIVCKKDHRTSSGKTYERSEWDSDEEERQEQRGMKGEPEPDESHRKKFRQQKTGRNGKHFVVFELTTLPTRASKAGTGGDTILRLLLFQADTEWQTPNGQSTFKGGSGGAYEKWNKLDVGSVIGLLNPKVIKPYSKNARARAQAHPLTNPVGLIPMSDKDIWYIGRSKDMATCQAKNKAGARCNNAIDLRTTKFCEYHVVSAVKQRKGGRAEFSSNTSGFEIGASSQNTDYTPNLPLKKGLLSKFGAGSVGAGNDAGGQTYIVEGRAFSTGRNAGEEFVGEQIGREKDRRMKRKREVEASEKDLQNLLKRDGGSATTGGKYLEAAERMQRAKKDSKSVASRSRDTTSPIEANDKPRPFNANAVKRLGFDPTLKPNGNSVESREAGKERLEAIALLNAGARAPAKLGPMPGTWNKSNAKIPARHLAALNATLPTSPKVEEELFVDLDSDDDV